MAITQSTFDTQPGGLYPGQSGDSSQQINQVLTVADGIEFTYGDAAFSSGDIAATNVIDAADVPLFEGVVGRFFRKGNAVVTNTKTGNQTGTKFKSPDSVTLSIFGKWAVVAETAITKKGQVALSAAGKFVEATAGAYLLEGATYQGTCAEGECVMVRFTGGQILTLIEAPAAI